MPEIHLTERQVAFIQASLETQENVYDQEQEMPVDTDRLIAACQMARNDIEAQTGIEADVFAPLRD